MPGIAPPTKSRALSHTVNRFHGGFPTKEESKVIRRKVPKVHEGYLDIQRLCPGDPSAWLQPSTLLTYFIGEQNRVLGAGDVSTVLSSGSFEENCGDSVKGGQKPSAATN